MAYNPNPIVAKLSLTELKDEVPVNNRTFVLLGGAVLNDILGGVFRYDTASTATPDDIDVIKPTTVLLANPGRYIRQKLGGAIIARGIFFSSVNISFTSNTPLVIPLNNNILATQFITHSTSSNTSRIIANKTGMLELSVSLQVLKGGAGASTIYFWLKKNGTLVANSAFKIDCSNNDTRLPFFTLSDLVNAGDYLEVAAQTASPNFSLVYTASPGAGIPNVPSIIITATLYNNFPS